MQNSTFGFRQELRWRSAVCWTPGFAGKFLLCRWCRVTPLLNFVWRWATPLEYTMVWSGLEYPQEHCTWTSCKPPKSSSGPARRTALGQSMPCKPRGHNCRCCRESTCKAPALCLVSLARPWHHQTSQLHNKLPPSKCARPDLAILLLLTRPFKVTTASSKLGTASALVPTLRVLAVLV